MKKITSRQRIVIVSFIITIVYTLMQGTDYRILLNVNFAFDPIKPIILALLAYIGTYWALFFKIKGERFFTVLFFPALGVFAISLFAEILVISILSEIGQAGLLLLSTIVIWTFTYITLLTVNILNTTYLEDIPLGQAARSALFVLSLLVMYIIYFLLAANEINIFIMVGVITASTFSIAYIDLWSINLEISKRIIASINIAVTILFASAVLSIWPISPPYFAIVLSIFLYVLLGISLEIREIINHWIWIEYVFLLVILALLLLVVAEWGINGLIF